MNLILYVPSGKQWRNSHLKDLCKYIQWKQHIIILLNSFYYFQMSVIHLYFFKIYHMQAGLSDCLSAEILALSCWFLWALYISNPLSFYFILCYRYFYHFPICLPKTFICIFRHLMIMCKGDTQTLVRFWFPTGTGQGSMAEWRLGTIAAAPRQWGFQSTKVIPTLAQ